MTARDIIVHAGADELASAVATRLAETIVAAQTARGTASVILTGGRIADKVYLSLRTDPAHDTVDWSRVDLWWGDERFLPAGDPDRNETQTRAALIDHLPVPPERVHPMPSTDGPDGASPEAAAARYAAEVAGAVFDVVLLGIGEDGHVASVFPGYPSVSETLPVAAVHDSPKPPPIRLTLTYPLLNSGTEVWVIASGEGKADAVGRALAAGATAADVPASGVHGTARTLFLIDEDAAAKLPGGLR